MADVVRHGQQRSDVRPGRAVLQSVVEIRGSRYLVRVLIDVDRSPPEVVTAYRTSKLDILEAGDMKVTYDEATDTLTVLLNEGVAVAESDEDRPGFVLDYDEEGDLVWPLGSRGQLTIHYRVTSVR